MILRAVYLGTVIDQVEIGDCDQITLARIIGLAQSPEIDVETVPNTTSTSDMRAR